MSPSVTAGKNGPGIWTLLVCVYNPTFHSLCLYAGQSNHLEKTRKKFLIVFLWVWDANTTLVGNSKLLERSQPVGPPPEEEGPHNSQPVSVSRGNAIGICSQWPHKELAAVTRCCSWCGPFLSTWQPQETYKFSSRPHVAERRGHMALQRDTISKECLVRVMQILLLTSAWPRWRAKQLIPSPHRENRTSPSPESPPSGYCVCPLLQSAT